MCRRCCWRGICGGIWTGIRASFGGDGMMLVVVAYDVSTESEDGRRRLRRGAELCEDFGQRGEKSGFECLVGAAQWGELGGRGAKSCEDFGQRVQKAVVECLVDAAQWVELRARLIGEIEAGPDSPRLY